MTDKEEAALDSIEQRISVLEKCLHLASAVAKALVAATGEESVCRGPHCRAKVYWIKHRDGTKHIYDPDGVTHWATCPDAGKFRKREEN